MDVRIERVSDDSPVLDAVLAWHWHEWAIGDETADRSAWAARLRSRSNLDRIPFTLVAYVDSEPSGCLTVCDDDRDTRFADREPWLSGMFVGARNRNLGVGRMLVRVAEETARAHGEGELWVYTAEAGPFYQRCGWSYVHRKERPNDFSVLRCPL